METVQTNSAVGIAAITGGNVFFNKVKSCIPFINLGSGSMANNGAITLTTALTAVYTGGAYVLLPAGAIAAGVPAASTWYWCVFISTTVGTVFNSTYTSGVPVTGTATAFATTGPGAYTGITSASPGQTIAIPGNTMGANGVLGVKHRMRYTNSAGAKLMVIQFGGTTFYSSGGNTTQVGEQAQIFIANQNATNIQDGSGGGIDFTGVGRGTGAVATIDTTASQNVVVSTTKAVATDHVISTTLIIELAVDGT